MIVLLVFILTLFLYSFDYDDHGYQESDLVKVGSFYNILRGYTYIWIHLYFKTHLHGLYKSGIIAFCSKLCFSCLNIQGILINPQINVISYTAFRWDSNSGHIVKVPILYQGYGIGQMDLLSLLRLTSWIQWIHTTKNVKNIFIPDL